ncbi:Fructokinase-2 [Sesamum angolense]|uniref:fructokinase n=1 Tax=Sesamum angolense TaxID=2727404 RepID=A0AAE2BJR3_9LAMI|nr:Fructokinase-2 [Sesamum angolense]
MAYYGGSSNGLIVSFGEMLIDFVPMVSGVSLADAPGFLKAPGGAPANVAIAVARLGGNAAFIGKLGDDEFGRMLAGILNENGVSTDGVTFDGGARTALAFVTLRADGEREFMFYRNPSADMLLAPHELNFHLIRSAKVFHYGSISLIVEPCRSAHLKAMEVAKDGGALLSYDPNLRLPLWPSAEEAREQILSIWEKADVIKVSDEELQFLTQSSIVDDESAMSLWHHNLKLLLVTLGDKGCRYYTKARNEGKTWRSRGGKREWGQKGCGSGTTPWGGGGGKVGAGNWGTATGERVTGGKAAGGGDLLWQ